MGLPQAVSGKGGGVGMKRGWKLFWIICGVVAAVGAACCIAALVMGVSAEKIEERFPGGIGFIERHIEVFDRNDWGDDAERERSGSGRNFEGVRSIDIDLLAGEVNIYTQEDASNRIMVETDHVDSRLKLECYMDEDELKIESTKKLFSLNHSKDAGEISIYIPRDMLLDEVSVEMAAGSLHVDDLQVTELSVEVDAGEAVVESFSADEAEFKCGAGSITASGEARVSVDINCGVGEIMYTASGKETDYNYEISCGIGQVQCGADSYSGLGKEKHIAHNAGKEMEIECGIGTVTIDFAYEDSNHHYEDDTDYHHYEDH